MSKSEIRNPKSETNSKSKTQKSESINHRGTEGTEKKTTAAPCSPCSVLDEYHVSSFELCFGFRVSNCGFPFTLSISCTCPVDSPRWHCACRPRVKHDQQPIESRRR